MTHLADDNDPGFDPSTHDDGGYEQPQAPPRRRSGAAHLIDVAAEAAVLSAVFATPGVYDDLAELLRVEDFGNAAHAEVWRAVVSCDTAGKGFDVITVAEELSRTKRLSKVGGREGLDRLVTNGARSGNLTAWAELIVEKARLRRVLAATSATTAMIMDPSAEAATVIEEAERLIFEASKSASTSDGPAPMAQVIAETLQAMAEASNRELLGLSTGLADLDKLTCGMQGGQLIVLAARPGMGKSSLGLAIAKYCAETGTNALFLSYEMSKLELTTRLLSEEIGVNMQVVRGGKLPAGADRKLAVAAEKLAALPLLIDDHPPATITALRSNLRRTARRHNLGVIVVDYLQLMGGERRGGGDDSRNQEVSDISRGLKLLARELDVPILALSQLNRNLEARADKHPQLSDLRDSGAVEQDADMVWFVYRDCMYNPSSPDTEAELIVAKQRQGPTGTVRLFFDPSCAHFRNAAPSFIDAHAASSSVGRGSGLPSSPSYGTPRFGRGNEPF